MSQESYNEESIRDLICDLNEIGLGPNLILELQFSVNPNQFLYTNVQKFLSAYWEKNSFRPETKITFTPEDSETRVFKIFVSGIERDVRKIQQGIPSFPWIDSESVSVVSEEWT